MPSEYFTDAPIIGTGDLGVSLSALMSPLTLHFGANGFWTSAVWPDLPASELTDGGDEFYSMTRIGTAFVSVEHPASGATWNAATQELYAARVNISTTEPGIGNVSVVALLANSTDLTAGINPNYVTGGRAEHGAGSD